MERTIKVRTFLGQAIDTFKEYIKTKGNLQIDYSLEEYMQEILDYIDYLEKENQELKLELSGYRQAILDNKEMLGLKEQNDKLKKKYENAVADYETTMSELQELRKQLEEKENIACNWKDSCLENAGKIEILENQQKEFIKYMNSCIKELEKGSPNKLQNTINLGIIDVTKTILQKYKSVIGDDK